MAGKNNNKKNKAKKANKNLSNKLKQASQMVKKAENVARAAAQAPKKPSLFRRTVAGIAGKWGVGDLANSALDIIGVGDYIFPNGQVQRAAPPVRIVRTEYIRDVLSTTDYGVWSHDINPTHDDLFPWLSQIATSFAKFKFVKLAFHYKPTSGNAISSTNNSLGLVGMVTNYDPAQPEFPTKVAAEAYAGRVTSVPSVGFYHGVECDPNKTAFKQFFTNLNSQAVNDPKLYYPGKLNIFTDGQQAAGIKLGEIWVEYIIDLLEPNIIPAGALNDSAEWDTGTSNRPINNLQPLGISAEDLKTDNSNLDVVATTSGSAAGQVFKFGAGTPSGRYAIYYLATILDADSNFNFYAQNLSANLSFSDVAGYNFGAWNAPSSTESTIKSMYAVINKSDTSEATFSLVADGEFNVLNSRVYMSIVPLNTSSETLSKMKQGALIAKVKDSLSFILEGYGIKLSDLVSLKKEAIATSGQKEPSLRKDSSIIDVPPL